jgi:hypothetical protein
MCWPREMSTRNPPETFCPSCCETVTFIVISCQVEAQRCAATLPVGETGVSKGKGGRERRGITRLTRAREIRARLHAPIQCESTEIR